MSTTMKLGRIQCVDGDRRTYFSLLEVEKSTVGSNKDDDDDDVMQTSTSVSILLTDVGKKAWTSTLTSEFFVAQAQTIKCTVDKYLTTTVACLTEASSLSDEFASNDKQQEKGSRYVCQVKELDTGDAELTWKRQLVDDDIFVKLGTVILRSSDLTNSLHSILAFGVNRIRELERLTEEHRIREEGYANERKTILNKFDACVTAKEEMERDLYAKFVAVINEKKAEIRRLSTSVEPVCEPGGKKSKKIVKTSSESDPDDFSSSDEIDSKARAFTHKRRPSPGPSCSKSGSSFDVEVEKLSVPPKKIIKPTAIASTSGVSTKKSINWFL